MFIEGETNTVNPIYSQQAFMLAEILGTRNNSHDRLIDIVSKVLIEEVPKKRPSHANKRAAVNLSQQTRSRLLFTIWVFNNTCKRAKLPSDIVWLIFAYTLRGIDKRRGCLAIFNACSIVCRYPKMGINRQYVWGDDLLRKLFPQDQYKVLKNP